MSLLLPVGAEARDAEEGEHSDQEPKNQEKKCNLGNEARVSEKSLPECDFLL